MTNDTRLSEGQFAEKSIQLFKDETNGKYDGLVDITPRVYFTGADRARGYVWNFEAQVAGNVARTVQNTIITATRKVATTTV
jgi:hypothetical protein